MRNFFLALILALSLPFTASAAIAFDTASGGNGSPSMGYTQSAGTLTNGILIINLFTNNANTLTAAPIVNNASATLVQSQSFGTDTDRLYTYCFLTSGGNLTVGATSTGGVIWVDSAAYSGVNQSCTLDAKTTNAVSGSQTSLTTSLTSVSNNDWFVGAGGGARAATASTGVTLRHADTTNTNTLIGDSNGPQAIGAYSMTITFASTNEEGFNMVALKPATASSVPFDANSQWWEIFQ